MLSTSFCGENNH